MPVLFEVLGEVILCFGEASGNGGVELHTGVVLDGLLADQVPSYSSEGLLLPSSGHCHGVHLLHLVLTVLVSPHCVPIGRIWSFDQWRGTLTGVWMAWGTALSLK